MLPACAQPAAVIKEILTDYATSIGLKIDFHKSTLIPMNCDPAKTQEIANIFGRAIGKLPFTYLGLPLGTTRPMVIELMPLVCSIERRLTATLNMISYGGKLSLLNSAITSLIIFAICTMGLPTKIIELLDKIRRKCLWIKKTDNGDKINSLASWDMVCRPKASGGLGVINLHVQGDALLLKYLHKFYNRWDTPWVQLIWDTYYTDQIPHASDPCGSFWWRDILKLHDAYTAIASVHINMGDSALFWTDAWFIGGSSRPLCWRLPRLFSFVNNDKVSVHEFLISQDIFTMFFLPLSHEAAQELQVLEDWIMALNRDTNIPDVWVWPGRSGSFSAKSFYTLMHSHLPTIQPCKWLWKSRCTMKIKVFGWLLFFDRLNTKDLLIRRH